MAQPPGREPRFDVLHPTETGPETEYVSFDRLRVLRVLTRIIADLDELASFPPNVDEEEAKGEDAEAGRVRHRKRLAEPDPPPKRLAIRENEPLCGSCWIFRHPRGGKRARSRPFRLNVLAHVSRLRLLARKTQSALPESVRPVSKSSTGPSLGRTPERRSALSEPREPGSAHPAGS